MIKINSWYILATLVAPRTCSFQSWGIPGENESAKPTGTLVIKDNPGGIVSQNPSEFKPEGLGSKLLLSFLPFNYEYSQGSYSKIWNVEFFNTFVWITTQLQGKDCLIYIRFFEAFNTLATKDAYLFYVFRVGVREYRDGIFLESKKSKYCMLILWQYCVIEISVNQIGHFQFSNTTLK